jgi:hypothetical protein
MFKLVLFKLVGVFCTLQKLTQFLKQLLASVSTICVNQLSFVKNRFKSTKYLRIVVHVYISNLITRHRRSGDLCPCD